MYLLDRLFHRPPPREAWADGEFEAMPVHFMTVGRMVFERIVYTTDPRPQFDIPFLHRTLLNELRQTARLRDEPYARFTPNCRAIPKSRTEGAAVWVRDICFPLSSAPADYLEGDCYPLRFRESGRYRVDFAERPADSPAGRARQRIARLRARGARPVKAALVQANSAMFEPGDGDFPGLVLFSADDRVPEEQLREWARAVFALKNTSPADPVEAAVAAIPTDERAVWYERHRLPRAFVGRHDVFVSDIFFHRPFLEEGYLDGSMIPCLVEPGERGRIEHVHEFDG